MLALIVALLAGAAEAPADPPSKTVSGVTVSPMPKAPPVAAVVDMAGDADMAPRDFVAIWPGAAYQTATAGKVTLVCKVDVHGLAERCQVGAETPKNKGFGKAALELRPTFKLDPAKGPDGAPVDAMMSINVRFVPPKRELTGTEGTNAGIKRLHDPMEIMRATVSAVGNFGSPLAMRAVTMLDNPVWIEAAGFEDLARAYPAKGDGVEGYAAAHCRVERSGARAGTLKDCQIIKETPDGHGFGAAALSLTAKFRLAPTALARAPNSTPVWVDIPIRMPPPAELADRTVMAPVWVAGLDPARTPQVFPPEAAASGLTSGRGVARCTVAADGTLAACAPEVGEPDGLGFSEAAAKLASGMKMNLWSADGAPVEGGVVHIPIRLNLKGG
jgi:hypothetical protein